MLLPVLVAGQFSDDFSDGNFSANPAWVGDADKFTVESGILRLTDNAAGSAYLATQSSVVANTQWEFWVRIAFTPSDNNHPKIYLVSDNQNLGGPLNGYYCRSAKQEQTTRGCISFARTAAAAWSLWQENTTWPLPQIM